MDKEQSYTADTVRPYKLALLIISVTVMILLTACGQIKPENIDGYYVLDSVVKDGIEYYGADLVSEGYSDCYVVLEDSNGYIVLMGTPEDISYDPEEKIIHTSYGDISAKVNKKNMVLEDSNVFMSFSLSKDPAPSKPDYPTIFVEAEVPDVEPESEPVEEPVADVTPEAEPEEEKTYMPIDEFWNGYWFGYWVVEDALLDNWEEKENKQYPVFAASSLESDGYSEIYVWDNEYQVADVVGNNNGSGLTPLGTFISEEGFFWDSDNLGHADWNIDPGLDDHDASLKIEGKVVYDGEDQYRYCIRLVKWGYDWDDFDADEKPDLYDWYKEQLDNGVTDPNTIDLPVEVEF